MLLQQRQRRRRRVLHPARERDLTPDRLGVDVVGFLHHHLEALHQRRRFHLSDDLGVGGGLAHIHHARAEAIRQRLRHVEGRCVRTRHVPRRLPVQAPAGQHRGLQWCDVTAVDIQRVPARHHLRHASPGRRIHVHLGRLPDLARQLVERLGVQPHVAGSLDRHRIRIRSTHHLRRNRVALPQLDQRRRGREHLRHRRRAQRIPRRPVKHHVAACRGHTTMELPQTRILSKIGEGLGQQGVVDKRRLCRHKRKRRLLEPKRRRMLNPRQLLMRSHTKPSNTTNRSQRQRACNPSPYLHRPKA